MAVAPEKPRIYEGSRIPSPIPTVLQVPEELLGLPVPEKATWMRMCLAELNRIHSHLVWLGTAALELGAISMFWYAFREREAILDLFEMVCGYRMHTRYFQVGGLAEDVPRGFYPECRKLMDWFPTAIVAYDQIDFRVPVHTTGDVYARYRVHIEEMRESVRIVEQCLDRVERMEGEPWIADDRKVVLPPRHELHTSMESLIHHFKIVTEGFRVPEGEVYTAVESARGELGCYVVSDGGPKPWRVHFRAPSFVALEATATCMRNALVADLIAIVGSLDTVMGEVDR